MSNGTPPPDAVTRARQLRDQGASFRITAETLTAEGYPAPKGGPWHAGTVFRLLAPPEPPGPGRGHHGPHTEESKRKMSESHKRGFAEGRRTGQNKHNAGKTHCPQGHPYDEENTYEIPGGGRGCKECTRQRTRGRRQRDKEANPPVPRVLEPPDGDLDYRMGTPGRRPYGIMHQRTRRARNPAKLYKCVHCAERGIDKDARDWACLRGRDGKDVEDYIPLCRRCHVYYDRGLVPPAPRAPKPSRPRRSRASDDPGRPGDPGLGQKRAEQQRAKTHCPAGHEYTEENTYIIKRSGGRTARQCKTCTRAKAAARARAKRKVA